ncbi:uncharacterized protein LOC112058340 [Bicyclus anynana]|uniref:Uncharacterized protein LOC112058340 n=1 Tax=Bicyclus anynana TaxID=110368 RepID=A0ABM3LJW9_BICAN|nr:uncharacterized protein LOC112058340 [Bicyclus anynana]
MEVVEDFDEDYAVILNIWKDIGAGKQFMYNIEGNLCESMKRNDTPWYPLVQALHTECPVKKGVYPVENLVMSLEFAKNVLNHEFCGDYIVEVSIGTIETPISCYEIGVAIEEVSCE